jgi:hypothetical protein
MMDCLKKGWKDEEEECVVVNGRFWKREARPKGMR